MFKYEEFVSNSHSLLIAPAGFGKTHTISECLKFTQGKQLILTHTHAGVASIKEKIRKSGTKPSSCNVETITGFAQKYVLSFYTGSDIPEQENAKSYYPFIIQKATELFNKKLVREIIKNTYSGLFVDEYQDCSSEQHQLILALSKLFPTRVLGDHLQGIFGFNSESLVNLQSSTDMAVFWSNYYRLEVPWRWKIGGNERLGEDLKDIRDLLESSQPINLSHFSSLELNISDDIYRNNRDRKKIFSILNEEKNLLVLTPESSHIKPRILFAQNFRNLCFLMESIDEKDFYILSKKLDEMTTENDPFLIFREILLKLFTKTGIEKWFNESGVKSKRKAEEKLLSDPIRSKIESLRRGVSYLDVSELLQDIKKLPDIKCYRKELFASLWRVLEEADEDSISVHEAMLRKRNMIRRVGRKIYGRCIGTTLLTKGLEFDTVLIINAHEFRCHKNLYVALTRASKRLIVFSKKHCLDPYLST